MRARLNIIEDPRNPILRQRIAKLYSQVAFRPFVLLEKPMPG